MKRIFKLVAITFLLTFTIQFSKAQSQVSSNRKDINDIENILEIRDIKSRLEKVELNNKNLKDDFLKITKVLNDSIAKLKSEIDNNKATIAIISNNYGMKSATDENTSKTQTNNVEATVSTNTLYWTIAVLALSFLSILLFVILRKQLCIKKTSI